MKICKKCGNERNDSEFTIIKSGKRKGYIYKLCIFCKRAENKIWTEQNKELAYSLVRAWSKKNRPKLKQYEDKYYNKNKEKIHTRHREYNKNNPTRVNKWWKNRREAKYVENQNRRALKKEVPGTHSLQEWEDLKKLYNYSCLRCGISEPQIKLSVDHIIPITKEFSSNYINNIQPLCRSCNSFKNARIIDFRPNRNIMMEA